MLTIIKRWFSPSKANSKAGRNEQPITVSLDQVKAAILLWERDMEDKIRRTVLLKADHSIDLYRLRHYLGGVSDQKYYMSRTTYQLFEEKDKDIAIYLDLVQVAVDDYMDEHPNMPVVTGTRNRQVHYEQLIQGHYLKERPGFPLYITTEDYMLSYEPDWNSVNK